MKNIRILMAATLAVLACAVSVAGPLVKLSGAPGSYYLEQYYPNKTITPDSDGNLEFQGTAMTMGYIYAAEGYQLISVTDKNTGAEKSIGANNDGVARCIISLTGSADTVYEYEVKALPESQVKSVTFTVSGLGSHIANISMIGVRTHTQIKVSSTPQSVTVDEGETFQIRSDKEGLNLYAVEVNGEKLAGDGYGTWYYTPTEGEKVVIYTDFPEGEAPVNFTLMGDEVNADVVSAISIDGKAVTTADWYNTDGKPLMVKMGSTLLVELDKTTFQNFSVTINGQSVSLPQGDVSFDLLVSDEEGYDIVISADKRTTGVDEVEVSVRATDSIYTLQGVPVHGALKAGQIYIVNGKCVVK